MLREVSNRVSWREEGDLPCSVRLMRGETVITILEKVVRTREKERSLKMGNLGEVGDPFFPRRRVTSAV